MLELVLLAIAPAIFVLWFLYSRDRYEPEPLGWVLKIFILGVFTVIPAAILESPFPEGIISSAIVAPVVEESLKFAVVYFTIFRNREFDEPMDGIVYAAAAGLGFATLENIFYVMQEGAGVGLLRAVASVPGHALFSCIWGFALGIAKFRPERQRPLIIASGLLGAMAFHGAFNFSLQVFDVAGLFLVLLVLIPIGWWILFRNIGRAQKDPDSWASRMSRGGGAAQTQAQAGPAGTTVSPPAGAAGTAPHRFCTGCGKPLLPGARFCRSCGKQV
jgi:RsiW-degrading membrane proteinase PrsW (M82 family)